jgi:hypothetical protein
MRFISVTLLLAVSLLFSECSEKDDPKLPVVQTLDVTNSTSSSRTFRGLLEHVGEADTIISYGFEWESRYGNWKSKKPGRIKKGNFFIRDLTPLSKWSSFTVRAFIETQSGVIYGDPKTFITEGK